MIKQINLTSSTADESVSGQETLLNVYPQKNIGGKYTFSLKSTPGLAPLINLPTYPILKMHRVAERAFVVTPSKMYEIFASGLSVELGDIDLSDEVSMADNGTDILIVDGFKTFAYNIPLATITEILDPVYYRATTVTSQDGYFIVSQKDSQRFYSSDLLSTNFGALDYATASGQPDNLVGVISAHREIYAFGSDSTEVYYNSGALEFPFAKNQSAFIGKGCSAKGTISEYDNTILFLGSDLVVYRVDGYTVSRISTLALETELKSVDVSDATAYHYSDNGHLFYVLTVPALHVTWCYDMTVGEWHKRSSLSHGRHISNHHIYLDNKNLVSDYQSGAIFHMSDSYLYDDDSAIIKEFILPTVFANKALISIYSFELDMEVGEKAPIVFQDNSAAILTVSNDRGRTWSNDKLASLGSLGEYTKRVKWRRLGNGREFILKVSISAPISLDIAGAYIEI